MLRRMEEALFTDDVGREWRITICRSDYDYDKVRIRTKLMSGEMRLVMPVFNMADIETHTRFLLSDLRGHAS